MDDQRQNEYYESIESYKKTSWLNFLKKSKKRKNVRWAKRLTRRSNNSLRSLNGSMHSGSGAPSIYASAGSPPGSNLAVDSIYDWTRSVHDASESGLSDRACSTELSGYPHETDGYLDHMGDTMENIASGQPPRPPQQNRRGADDYKAYGINPDSSLYESARNRVRQPSLGGVGMYEAKMWHCCAYGGLGELNQMLPTHIGHAAAYEAYRTWLYKPLSGDPERQREGMIRLAVAEASRLLQSSNWGTEDYSRITASETAAATAAVIFYDTRDEDGHRSRFRSRHHRDHGRHGSFSGDGYDDPCAPDSARHHDRSHSHSRHRSHPTSSRHSPMPQMAGSVVSSLAPMAISSVGDAYGNPYAQSYGAAPTQIRGQNSPYGSTAGMAMNAAQPYGPLPSVGANTLPMVRSSYGAVVMQGHDHHRHRTSSMSIPYAYRQYSQMPYPHGRYTNAMMPRQIMTTAQPTIILLGSGYRKHNESKRSRSIDY